MRHLSLSKVSLIFLILVCFLNISANAASGNNYGDKHHMKIKVESNGKSAVFELNGSNASMDLYSQLPLKIKIENYGGNEKIFYPPTKLNTSDTPKANAKAGSLSYYAPWGDVVIFYKDFGSASGLYDLGKIISGMENISGLTGVVTIERGE